MKKHRIETEGNSQGLTHNPFAALRSEGQAAQSTPIEPVLDSEQIVSPKTAVVVRREKKGRRGKTVTRISGMDLAAPKLDELKRELTKALGCGGTIEEADVLLQGDLTARAAKWLGEHLKVPVTIGN